METLNVLTINKTPTHPCCVWVLQMLRVRCTDLGVGDGEPVVENELPK